MYGVGSHIKPDSHAISFSAREAIHWLCTKMWWLVKARAACTLMHLQVLRLDFLRLLNAQAALVTVTRHAARERSVALCTHGIATFPAKDQVLRPRAHIWVDTPPGVVWFLDWWTPAFAVEAGACSAPHAPWEVQCGHARRAHCRNCKMSTVPGR